VVDIKEEELEKESSEQETKTPMEVTQEALQFHKEKEQIEEQRNQEKNNPKPKQEEKPAKPKPTKSEIDMSHLNAFKEKIIKEFDLESKVDSAGHHLLYFKNYSGVVIKLLPRKNWLFGICREVPEENNIWKAFRIHKPEEIKPHYEYLKKLAEVNKEK